MSVGQVALTTLILTVAIAARYVLVVWAVYALVWGRKDGRVTGRRLNRDRPKAATIRHELKLSLLSSWIYALPAAVVWEAWRGGGTLFYVGGGTSGRLAVLDAALRTFNITAASSNSARHEMLATACFLILISPDYLVQK